MKDATKSDPRAGLSLVEVLLALTILGIGLTAWMTAAARGLAVISQSQRYALSRHLLERVELDHPPAFEETLSEGVEHGDFGPEVPGARWQREIIAEDAAGEGLYRIVTRVLWTEHGRAIHDEIITLRYAPETPYGGSFMRPDP